MGEPRNKFDIQAIQASWQALDAKAHLRPIHDEKAMNVCWHQSSKRGQHRIHFHSCL